MMMVMMDKKTPMFSPISFCDTIIGGINGLVHIYFAYSNFDTD
jgi:hypothetical protein